MTRVPTKSSGAERPWTVYKHKDGSRDKLYELGWAGELTPEEIDCLQDALTKDPGLAYWWGWRPGMKRRAVAAIERVAMNGAPDDRGHNVRLVREAGRRPKVDTESVLARVKKAVIPSPPRMGRRKVEGWESELLRLAGTGMGVHKIAKALQAQGVEISGPTVSVRLRELKGQLRLIS
jgi:hypothetical protein